MDCIDPKTLIVWTLIKIRLKLAGHKYGSYWPSGKVFNR